MTVRFIQTAACVLVALVTIWSATTAAVACDTPVYRYAMYRWPPSPYFVLYFHQGEIAEAEKPTHDAIYALMDDREKQTNLLLEPIDLSEEGALAQLRPEVQALWNTREDRANTGYLVISPRGREIFSGRTLDADTLAAMIASAKRDEIVERLAAGDPCVLVLMRSGHEESDAAAEKEVQQVVDDLAAGKVPMSIGPPAMLPEGEEPSYEVPVGLVKLDREDMTERWLIRSLLALEPDLPELSKPMVFAVYGRGRALEPCVGPGIVRDNLLDYVAFVTGACSCQIKEQNPGVDLLTSTNWDAAAAALAEQVGVEEGNEQHLQQLDFFPEMLVPADGSDEPASDGVVDSPEEQPADLEPADDASPPSTSDPAAESAPSPDSPPGAADDVHREATPAAPLVTPTEVDRRSPPAEAQSAHTAGPMYMMIGAGVAIGLLVLLSATMLLLGRRA